MKELFDPANFVWLIPLCLFGLSIFLLTCYLLRKEIAAFKDSLLAPYRKNNKAVGIITKGSATMQASAPAPKPILAAQPEQEEEAPILPPAPPPAPKKVKVQKAEQEEPAALPQEQKDGLFSKTANYFKVIFSSQEEVPFSPQQEQPSVKEVQKIQPSKPVQDALPPTALVEELLPSAALREELRAEEQPPAFTAPAPAPKEQPQTQAQPAAKPFFSDRYVLIFSLLVLCGFVIFLGARVKLLSSVIQRQQLDIRLLKEQVLQLNTGNQTPKKVIIYVPMGNTQK